MKYLYQKTIALILLASLFANGQSPILEQYVKAGIESNLALKQQNLEIEKAIKAIAIARSSLFPKIAFAPTYTLASGGRSIEFPIGDLLNPVYGTLNQLTQSSEFPTIPNESIQFAPNNFQETKLDFQLPLFNTDIKYNILLQKEFVKTEEAKKALLKYELKYNIEAAYFQYIQSLEAIKVYKGSQEFLNDFLAFNQKLVANQVALKDVIYSAEYEINNLETDLAEAKKNNLTAKAYFNFLINREYDAPVVIDTLIFQHTPTSADMPVLQASALLNRPEFHQLQNGLNVNNTVLQMQEKNAKLPSVFLGGSTGFQGYGFKFKDQAFVIGQVGLNWDIFNGHEKKHKIQKTRINKSILETRIEEAQQQIKLQVAQAYFEFEAAKEALNSSKKGLQNVERLLSLVNKKYKNKEALYIEVLKAENDHLVSSLKVSLAKYNVWVFKAKLDKASGN